MAEAPPPSDWQVERELRQAARRARRAAWYAKPTPEAKLAHGPGAKSGKESLRRQIQRENVRRDALSMYAAGLLMPDEAGLRRAQLVVCANTLRRFDRTLAQDAIVILEALGIRPPKREDQDGPGTQE